MSTSSNEPNAQGHPAYQEILDALPESLRPIVLPKLEAMDKGVQDKLQAVQSQYDPYKEFADGKVDPGVIKQSLYLANMLQQDPEGFVRRAIDNFNLEAFKQQQQAQQQVVTSELDEEWEGVDVTKHPAVKQMMDQLNTLQQTQQTWQQQQEQSQYEQQLEAYLDGLEKEHGEFDRLYVSALVANEVDGPQAIKQWQDSVNAAALKLTGGDPAKLAELQQQATQQQSNQQQTQQPPVVMGAAGTAGSGSPSGDINFGNMKDGDVQDVVLQMLANAAKDS